MGSSQIRSWACLCVPLPPADRTVVAEAQLTTVALMLKSKCVDDGNSMLYRLLGGFVE